MNVVKKTKDFSFAPAVRTGLWAAGILLVATMDASAAGLPWEGPLEMVMQSLCGPVAKASAVIAFVVTGLLVAFGEAKGMFGTMLRIAFGLSLALMAVTWLGNFGVGGMSC